MLYGLLKESMQDSAIMFLGAFTVLIANFFLLKYPFGFLPRDGGKFAFDKDGNKIEVNQQSVGKITGAGVIFVTVFLIGVMNFIQPEIEKTLYVVLMIVMMATGFLDDRAQTPWGELIKGILDFILALTGGICFVYFNNTDIIIFGNTVHIPKVLYVVLAVILIWASINVTNCSDGVDGLCGGVSILSMAAYIILFGSVKSFTDYAFTSVIFIAALIAYLIYNWYPSRVLMGDAGSRTIGFFLAVLAMKSRHPLLFILLSFVFLFDGGLGLLRLVMMRTIKFKFLPNVRFPFHDHLRKNLKWSVRKTALFFCIAQVIFDVIAIVLVKLTSH